jgi:hypothetical protein
MMHRTIRWKQARTKLMRTMAEGPRHAVLLPEFSGHCKKEGRILNILFVRKSIAIAIMTQNIWKKR